MSREKSFQAPAEKPLGTDFHQTISKQSSACWLLIKPKKGFVLLCPIGEQQLLFHFFSCVSKGRLLSCHTCPLLSPRLCVQGKLSFPTLPLLETEELQMIREDISDAISRTILICSVDLLQVDFTSFLASEGSFLGREAAKRATKSREVDLSRLRGCHLRFSSSTQTWGEALPAFGVSGCIFESTRLQWRNVLIPL